VQIAIAGSHGLIGTALSQRLESTGHSVVRLARDAPSAEGCDAVVNLAGAGIGDARWTDARRRELETSRVDFTARVSAAMAAQGARPSVLLNASAVGYYGDRADEVLTEASGPGAGYLASLCQRWEAATAEASAASVRVVHLRSGVVLSRAGGALRRQLPLFRIGLGGRLGSGRQYVSWVALDDEVRAIEFLLSSSLQGAVNLTAPLPVTNAAFTTALGRALRRPAVLAVPAVALRVALGGELADEMVLASQRAEPAALHAAGFSFEYPTIDAALAHTLG
jgi:uncharacterized protein (TIGR01777 family)